MVRRCASVNRSACSTRNIAINAFPLKSGSACSHTNALPQMHSKGSLRVRRCRGPVTLAAWVGHVSPLHRILGNSAMDRPLLVLAGVSRISGAVAATKADRLHVRIGGRGLLDGVHTGSRPGISCHCQRTVSKVTVYSTAGRPVIGYDGSGVASRVGVGSQVAVGLGVEVGTAVEVGTPVELATRHRPRHRQQPGR